MASLKLSVIICAYNPKADIFTRVIESLKNQSLAKEYWELIIIDNNSIEPMQQWVDTSWHPDSKIINEKKQGLIFSRNRGTEEAKYDYLISVDDDTPLFNDYLENALKIFEKHPDIGIIGGRSYPLYECTPPSFVHSFPSFLAIRDLGEEVILEKLSDGTSITHYPVCSPILIAPQKKCMLAYKSFFKMSNTSKQLGRKGDSLASGEDNDINLFIYKSGYALGYFPELKFYHIIPKERLNISYFQRMAFESNRSWVKVLNNHGICPWKSINKWTYPIRKIKSYITNKAWLSEINSIKYFSSIGTLKGLTEIDV